MREGKSGPLPHPHIKFGLSIYYIITYRVNVATSQSFYNGL